ncbi:hypothetical protein TNCV_4187411 [Trichonephila clavipes]|nr:hypothetical protein TNCV_4187411 [Trichonephila clavipes]
MPKEGAFRHLIVVSYPRQDKRSKGNGWAFQHDFMLLTVKYVGFSLIKQICVLKKPGVKVEAIWLKNEVSPRSLKKRDRKVRQFFDDFNADEKLQDRERLFEVDVFKANVDVITTQLKIALRLMRTETVETFELVKVKQKLLDIRAEKEREERTREVREQALPSEYHRQTYL